MSETAGGAAEALGGGGDPTPTPSPTPTPTPSPTPSPSPAPTPTPSPTPSPSPAASEWLSSFSAEGGDADNPSHRAWLEAKGFKTPDDVIKSYRETEKALRDSGRVAIPKDGAPPEEVAAFHKAIGVPDSADGYEVSPIEGHELDDGLIGAIRPIAHKLGVPAGAFKGLADALVAHQLEQLQAESAAQNELAEKVFKEWGPSKDEKLALAQRAAGAMGWENADLAAIQRAIGSDRLLAKLAELGGNLAETSLVGGGDRKFAMTAEQARTQLTALNGDKEHQAKVAAGDKTEIARRDRLYEIIAADEERQKRAAAG